MKTECFLCGASFVAIGRPNHCWLINWWLSNHLSKPSTYACSMYHLLLFVLFEYSLYICSYSVQDILLCGIYARREAAFGNIDHARRVFDMALSSTKVLPVVWLSVIYPRSFPLLCIPFTVSEIWLTQVFTYPWFNSECKIKCTSFTFMVRGDGALKWHG